MRKGSQIEVIGCVHPVVGSVELIPNMLAGPIQLFVTLDELVVAVEINLDILSDFPQNSYVRGSWTARRDHRTNGFGPLGGRGDGCCG